MIAEQFIADAIERNGTSPHTVQADRGVSMTSGLVSELLTFLCVVRSHSRPKVSNDNPYSEAQFQDPEVSSRFSDIVCLVDDARTFLKGFFNECNHIHQRHSAIGKAASITRLVQPDWTSQLAVVPLRSTGAETDSGGRRESEHRQLCKTSLLELKKSRGWHPRGCARCMISDRMLGCRTWTANPPRWWLLAAGSSARVKV